MGVVVLAIVVKENLRSVRPDCGKEEGEGLSPRMLRAEL